MNIHKSFTVWALFFGSILCFLIPPFQSPDEPNHFLRAYQVSEGNFWPEKTEDMRLGGILPSELKNTIDNYSYLRDSHFRLGLLNEIGNDLLQARLEAKQTKFIDFPNTAIYAPTAHLPQAAVLFFGKKTNCAPLLLLYLSRLANMLLWLIIMRSAIRLLPFGKKIFAYLALLPASLVIASSCNADVITNALCFWVFAFFLSKNQKEATDSSFFTLKNIKLIGALVIIAINKIVFAPFALLVFLVFLKKEIQVKTRQLLAPILLCSVVFSTALLWAKTSSSLFIPFDSYNTEQRIFQTLNEGVNPDAQLQFIFENPIQFMKTMAVSYFKAAPSTAAHIVGKFGWEKNYIPSYMVGLLWIGLFVLLFFEKTALNIKQRFLLFGTASLCILLFSITMYCLWMPVGSSVLGNLQGRYFVPILPLLCFAFIRKKEPFPLKIKEKWLNFTFQGILLLGNLSMLFSIYQRYWS